MLADIEGLQRRTDADLSRHLAPARAHGLRGSYGRILGLIPDDGTRPSTLAEGAWITKQSVGQRVRELEERGWVTIEPDPTDGRAQIVRRTAEGDRMRQVTEAGIAAMEQEWADAVGAERYRIFREVVEELGLSRRA